MNLKNIYRSFLLILCLSSCGGSGGNDIVPEIEINPGTGGINTDSPAPTIVSAISGHGSIIITWTGESSDNWLYMAELLSISSANFSSLLGGKAFSADSFSGDGSITIHCLSSSKEYYFVMRSKYRHGNFLSYYDDYSVDSNVVSASPLSSSSLPEPLTGLQAINGVDYVELIFNKPELNEIQQEFQTYNIYVAREPWLDWHEGLENAKILYGQRANYQDPMRLRVAELEKNIEYHFAISSECGDESVLTAPVNGMITSAIESRQLANLNAMEPGDSGQAILGKLYIVGIDKETQSQVLNIYDPESNSWTEGIAPIEKRRFPASAVIGNNLYIAGGSSTTGITNTLSVYQADSPSWTVMAPMPSPLKGATMLNLNGKLVVIGGTDESGNVNQHIDIYDPNTDSWERSAQQLNNKYDIKAEVMGDKLLVISPEELWNENFYLFDIETGEKTILAPFPHSFKSWFPQRYRYYSTVVNGNFLYVVPTDKDDGVYVYSFAKNSWERQSDRLRNLADAPVLAVISNELYVAERTIYQLKDQGGTTVGWNLRNYTSLEKLILIK